MKSLNIALFGHGVVGGGVSRILLAHDFLVLAGICTRSPQKDALFLHSPELFRSADELLNDPKIEIVVETIGGTGVALDFVRRALRAGKSVVTANKEMMAKHFIELYALARKNNVFLLCEAAVAGGIPVLSALSRGLSGDEIQEVDGIINGTSNFVLTEMEQHGTNFSEALSEAQKLGYAEADPTNDIDGFDALYKLVILIHLAFHAEVDMETIPTQSISKLCPADFQYASHFGMRIKPAAFALREKEGIAAEVSPMLFSKDNPIAKTDGVMNAVSFRGKYNTKGNFLSGEGAGRFPTAAAIVSNIVTISRNGGAYPAHLEKKLITTETPCAYYVRFVVSDSHGIIGKIGTILGKHHISLNAVSQHQNQKSDKEIHFALTTFPAKRVDFLRAIDEVAQETFNTKPPLVLPIRR